MTQTRPMSNPPALTKSCRPYLIVVAVLLAANSAPPARAGLDRWTPAGPDGGTVADVAVALDGTVYASTQSNAIFRSSDAGGTWRRVSNGLLLRTTYSLALHPRLSRVLFAVSPRRGIFRSADGGATWRRWSEERGLERIFIAPSRPSIVYGISEAGRGQGIVRSDDGGVTWTPLDAFGPILVVHPTDPDVVYLGSQGRVNRSHDGGRTWTEGRDAFGADVVSLVIDPRDPRVLYAGSYFTAYGPPQGSRVWKSRDGGRTWAPAGAGLGARARRVELEIDPASPQRLYAAVARDNRAVGEVFRTTNGGASWQRLTFTQPVQDLAVDPRRTARVYAALERTGVLTSADGGGRWTPATRGLKGMEVRLVAADPHTPGTLLAAASAGPFLTRDGGMTWRYLGDELRRATFAIHVLAFDPAAPGVAYMGTQSGVWRSDDGGATWQPAREGLERPVVDALAAHSTRTGLLLAASYEVAPCPRDSGYDTYCTSFGLFRSEDGGGLWSPLPEFDRLLGLTPPFEETRFLAPLFDPLDPALAYLAAGGFFRSTDAGESWSEVGTAPGIGRLYVAPGSPGVLYQVGGRGTPRSLYRSADGGATWTPFDVGIPGLGPTGLELSALAIDVETPSTLYAASYQHGVYRSLDGGASWTPLHAGLPLEPPYLDLAVDPTDPRRVYAAARGAGGLFVFTRSD